MKRIISLAVLLAVIALPSIAFAAEKTGIYVTPKLITGWTSAKANSIDEDGSSKLFKKTKGTIGGGLAIGYDFYRQSQVPLRMELEYSAFSATKGKKSGSYSEIHNPAKAGDYTESGTMNAKVQAQTLFLNTYYDFHNSSKITPYVSAGLGLAFLRAKAGYSGTRIDYEDGGSGTFVPGKPATDDFSYGAKTTTNFAWNVGAGVAYDVTETLSIDLGYRFASLGSAKTKKHDGDYVKFKNVNMHQIVLGARLTF